MPTNDPKLVEEVLKLFITHVESKGKGQVQGDEKKYNVNTKIVGLHTLVGKTKIPNDYEELDKNLQEWYSQRNKRSTEGTSESSDKRIKLNMIKGSTKEDERSKDIEEIGYKIGSEGEAAIHLKNQMIGEIDQEHKRLLEENVKIKSEIRYNRFHQIIEETYEKEIKVLWQKVTTYELYSIEERNLRIQAVEELRRHEEKLFGKVKDIVLPEQGPTKGKWSTPSESSKQSESSKPSFKMMRINSDQGLTPEGEAVLIQRLEQAGEEHHQRYQRFLEDARTAQSNQNGNVREHIQRGDQDGLVQLGEDQTRLDYRIHRGLSEFYERERMMRLETLNELKVKEQKLIQLQLINSELKRSEGPRQEIRLQTEKRGREEDNIRFKEAPSNCPPRPDNQEKIPTFKSPPTSKAKMSINSPPPKRSHSVQEELNRSPLSTVQEELKEEQPPPPNTPHPEEVKRELERKNLEAKQKEEREAKAKEKARRDRELQEDKKNKYQQ